MKHSLREIIKIGFLI